MTPVTRAMWRSPYFWLSVIFCISRAIYALMGIEFDTGRIEFFWQFLDPDLLRRDLLRSIFYLHIQPPGFNLFAGIILKLFPNAYGAAFHAVYLACGLLTGLCVYKLLRYFGVRNALAFTLAALFEISPGMVLFENCPQYEYLILALCCFAAVALGLAIERRSGRWLAAFYGALFIVCFTRATYHLFFYGAIALALWRFFPPLRRATVWAGGLGFLLLFGLYAKNYILFGEFSPSTWMGFQIATITRDQVPPPKLEEFARQGVISHVGVLPIWTSLKYYGPYVTTPPPTGIPALDNVNNLSGKPNFNANIYAPLRRQYLKDGKALVLHYPICYIRSIAIAWFAYFLPTGDFPFFPENRLKIYAWDRAWDALVFGQWKDATNREEMRVGAAASPATAIFYTGSYLVVALPALWCWCAYLLYRRRQRFTDAQYAVLVFMFANIVIITLISNFLSSYENNRYRLPLDGFHLVLFGMAVTALRDRFRERKIQTALPEPELDDVTPKPALAES